MFNDVVVDKSCGDDDDNCTNATTIQWLSDTNTMSAMRNDERMPTREFREGMMMTRRSAGTTTPQFDTFFSGNVTIHEHQFPGGGE
jgi:hypothetical protein